MINKKVFKEYDLNHIKEVELSLANYGSIKQERIARFLSVPFNQRRPPSISETLSVISHAVKEVVKKVEKK